MSVENQIDQAAAQAVMTDALRNFVYFELEDAFTQISQAMTEHDVNVSFNIVERIEDEGGVFIVRFETTTWTKRSVVAGFKIVYSGSKAVGSYDLFEWAREAWPPHNHKWIYRGLVSYEHLARDMAIISHAQQYPGTAMGRW